jgi:hypothetical protein
MQYAFAMKPTDYAAHAQAGGGSLSETATKLAATAVSISKIDQRRLFSPAENKALVQFAS